MAGSALTIQAMREKPVPRFPMLMKRDEVHFNNDGEMSN